MSSITWRLGPLILLFACGAVVVGAPSELEHLGLTKTAGLPLAQAYLAVIAACAAIVALWPNASRSRIALLVAAGCLVAYGAGAFIGSQWAALPSAGFAGFVALLLVDRADAIREANA